jgi:hypothetical protein
LVRRTPRISCEARLNEERPILDDFLQVEGPRFVSCIRLFGGCVILKLVPLRKAKARDDRPRNHEERHKDHDCDASAELAVQTPQGLVVGGWVPDE